MKKTLIVICISLCLLAQTVAARPHAFGLGIITGEPSGISGKLWLSNKTAVDGAMAWSLETNANFQIHGDFLIHDYTLIKVQKGSLPVYYGIGGRLRTWDNNGDDNIGVRFPFGLDYIFPSNRVDLFLEVVPVLDLAPDTDVQFNGALGFRYFF
ncbi:MAG: hypothetical protein HY851_12295 [candidate division Zixibacteria bacterium]|nr:hypothetical protein [candidate division Zixibacteria bacterium]